MNKDDIVSRFEILEKKYSDLQKIYSVERILIKKFNILFNAATESIIITDVDGKIELANAITEEMFGYSPEELIGKHIEILIPNNLREKHVAHRKKYNNDFSSKKMSQRQGLTGLRKDGVIFPVEVGLNHVNFENDISIIAIISDITERVKTEKALQESEKIQREAVRTKDKFFSIIAHDLRNPLSSFRDITKLMAESYEGFTEEDKSEFIRLMNNSADHLYKLLENLLNWSRAQTGKLQFNPESLNINKIINSNIALQLMHAHKKNIEILYDGSENITGFGDTNMITTVIRNLVSNAIKFTNENGKITINARYKESFVEVSVSDDGIGISEEDRKKLFRIDVHHSTIGTSHEEGTGLGLILCKEFVEKNGGNIWVESILGKGTSFFFTIPKI